MITRTYQTGCNNCDGRGYIFQQFPKSTAASEPCKVCNGSGVMTVTEEEV